MGCCRPSATISRVDLASLRQLRRQPGYPALIGAATAARLADEMFAVGVVLLVLERTGSAALAGATIACVALPSLLSGPLLGAWLDLTGSRRAVMVVDQLLMVSTLMLLATLTGSVPNWCVPMIALIAGITYPLSFGGFTSLVPTVVPDHLLAQANALEATSFNTALIAGPALAGTICALTDPVVSLSVEAALTLVAIVPIMRLPAVRARGRASASALRRTARHGLALLIRTPELRGVTATGMLGLGGIGLLTVAFPFFALDVLGEPRSASGYMWAAFALGSAFGALTLVRLQARWPSQRIVFGGAATFGLLMLLWPLAWSLPAALVLIAVAGMADGPALTATFATRQEHAPRDLLGQVFVTAASLKVGSFAVGAALAGPAVLVLGAQGAIVLSACAQLTAAAVGLLLSEVGRPSEELYEHDGVGHQHDGEADRPPVEVAFDHRAAAERSGPGATDPERAGQAGVFAGVQQHQENQTDRQSHLHD